MSADTKADSSTFENVISFVWLLPRGWGFCVSLAVLRGTRHSAAVRQPANLHVYCHEGPQTSSGPGTGVLPRANPPAPPLFSSAQESTRFTKSLLFR